MSGKPPGWRIPGRVNIVRRMERGCHTESRPNHHAPRHYIQGSRGCRWASCSKVTGIPRNTVLRVFDQTMAFRGTVYREYRHNHSLTAGGKVPISDCKLAAGEGGDSVVLDSKLAVEREKSEVLDSTLSGRLWGMVGASGCRCSPG